MKFDKYKPTTQLQPYIKHYVLSEHDEANAYKVLPTSGLVIGFQYQGQLATIKDSFEISLASAGITGIADTYKVFKNTAGTGTVLVYFTDIGFTHFTAHPAHEIFNLSLSLDYLFDKTSVAEVEDKLAVASTDQQRILIVEQFLLGQLKDKETDKLIIEAVRLIYASHGTIRIKELNGKLHISQSPFEKRFRKVVGTTAKKFASIVRLHAVIDELSTSKSLTDICYAYNFFDQAHFIKDFKQMTGDTPEHFKHLL
jgi:AraC-like DNA-binding protein